MGGVRGCLLEEMTLWFTLIVYTIKPCNLEEEGEERGRGERERREGEERESKGRERERREIDKDSKKRGRWKRNGRAFRKSKFKFLYCT